MKLRAPDRLEEHDIRVFFGKHAHINTNDADNGELVTQCWRKFSEMGVLDELRAMASPDARGFTAACTGFTGNSYDYWIGIEVEHGTKLPAGYEKLVAPKGEYAYFICSGKAPKSVTDTWRYLYMKWFPRAPYTHASELEFEFYPFGEMNSSDYEAWIYFPVKKNEMPQFMRRETRNGIGGVFAAVGGAVLGAIIASGTDRPLIAALIVGLLGYFLFVYISKRIKNRKSKTKSS